MTAGITSDQQDIGSLQPSREMRVQGLKILLTGGCDSYFFLIRAKNGNFSEVSHEICESACLLCNPPVSLL